MRPAIGNRRGSPFFAREALRRTNPSEVSTSLTYDGTRYAHELEDIALAWGNEERMEQLRRKVTEWAADAWNNHVLIDRASFEEWLQAARTRKGDDPWKCGWADEDGTGCDVPVQAEGDLLCETHGEKKPGAEH